MIKNLSSLRSVSFCLLILSLFILSACGEEEEKPAPPKTVSWIEIGDTNQDVVREIAGILQPAETAQISFEVPGIVESVKVDLGQRFEEGDILAELDKNVYELTVKQREGELSEARARLVEARNDYNRKRDLVSSGTVSKSEFDSAKSTFEAAKAQVEVAKSQLGLAQEDLDDATLIAPYSGSISMRNIEPSQRVAAGTVAFEIQGNAALEVAVSVPETIIGQLTLKDTAHITFPAAGDAQNINGTITEIGTQAENANAFPVVLTLPQQFSFLKPGMTAEVVFALNNSNADKQGFFRVPATAVHAGDQDGYYIYKIIGQDDGKILQKASVTLQEMREQDVFITGDIKSGDKIVRAGLPFLNDQQKVSLIGTDTKRYND